VAQRASFGTYQQPPLPLVQVREQRLELGRQRLLYLHRYAHTTPTKIQSKNDALILCKP